MCDICMCSPCLSGCPNAPDPTPVAHCCSCGEPIIPGDEYGIIDGEAWCEDCLEDLPLCVLIAPRMTLTARRSRNTCGCSVTTGRHPETRAMGGSTTLPCSDTTAS